MFYIIAFACSVLHVGAKAFQQLNVVHDQKIAVVLTSFFIALFEISIFGILTTKFISQGLDALWMVIPIGLGGGLGCLLSMYIHKNMRHKNEP
jgi:hypothetical protein